MRSSVVAAAVIVGTTVLASFACGDEMSGTASADGGSDACARAACDAGCVDTLTDRLHCGGCGLACPEGAECNDGICVCSSGTEACAETCTDTKTDPNHCGGCGVVCGAGASCVDGVCRCSGDVPGKECVAKPASTARTFCAANGKCTHAMPVELAGCLGAETVFGEDGGVVMTCHVGGSSVTDVFFKPKNGVFTSCGFAPSPAMTTDGTTLLTVSLNGPAMHRCDGNGHEAVASQGALINGSAVGGGYIFWLSSEKLMRCPSTGCVDVPEEIASAPPGQAALDADASGVYAMFGSTLGHWSLMGGLFTELGTVSDAIRILVDGDRIVVTTSKGIVSCPKSGCPAGATPFVTEADPRYVQTDATDVWWLSGGIVRRCAKTSSPCSQPTVVVAADAFAVTDAELYIAGAAGVDVVSK